VGTAAKGSCNESLEGISTQLLDPVSLGKEKKDPSYGMNLLLGSKREEK